MFIWDFLMDEVMEQLTMWIYGSIVNFLSGFFAEMGNMGIELFKLSWVQIIVLFFSRFAWALYVVGMIVCCFETAINYQNGKGDIKESLLATVKGFLAVSLFSVVPIRLFELSINLQQQLTSGITGVTNGVGDLAICILNTLPTPDKISSGLNSFGGMHNLNNPFMLIFIVIMMGYAVLKVFFANLKRGGILLIQIAVGSLYMFSVPRGYYDGFFSWCKQIIGLCLTAFLQTTILSAGLMILPSHALIGMGCMLSATEVPRIAGAFGLDTSTKANITSAVYTTQAAVNTTKTIMASKMA